MHFIKNCKLLLLTQNKLMANPGEPFSSLQMGQLISTLWVHLPESFVRPESLSEIMTTDLSWWGVLIRNSLGASWKCTLRPPAPKCTLFKDFLSIKIFLDMLSLLKAWPLMDEVAVTMLWFDFINIFRIHNQLKCHMILILGKDIMAPVASLIVMTDTSGGLLLASDWSAEITWPEYWPLIGHCSHVMSLWSAETAYQGTLSWPGASCPGENILVTGG